MSDETVSAIRAHIYQEVEHLKSLGDDQWITGVSYMFLQLYLQLKTLEHIDEIERMLAKWHNGEAPSMSHFLVILEAGEHNYSAYVPDLPGCVATGQSREAVEKNIREAIVLHLKGMSEDQEPVPFPRLSTVYIDVPSQGS